MAGGKKLDNFNPQAKLDLRRYMLRKHHAAGEIKVLDCCQGSGVLWSTLKAEFPVSTYFPLDMKEKAGRLQFDSRRVLSRGGLPENVIDVDCYGSPWKWYVSLLPHVWQPTTVFLTIGQAGISTDSVILDSLGLKNLNVPAGIARRLHDQSVQYCLARCYEYGVTPDEIVEFKAGGGRARYLGVRLLPRSPRVSVSAGAPTTTVPGENDVRENSDRVDHTHS